jgi:hypothetical protein
MDDIHDKRRLRQAIIEMSDADTWEEARQEWGFVGVEYRDEGFCLCGKRIKEHCHIVNPTTFSRTHVGNECIKHFTGVIKQADCTKEIFQAVKKLTKNFFTHPGGHLAALAFQNGWIRLNDYKFLQTTERRSLTTPQLSWMRDINKRIAKGLASEPSKYEPKPKRDKRRDNDRPFVTSSRLF